MASWYFDQWMRELLLWSIRNPITTGWRSLWLKNSMRCGLPSSSTRKSLSSRLLTKRPLSSVTVTGTITSLVPVRITTPGFAGCDGGVCWVPPQVAHRRKTTGMRRDGMAFFGPILRLCAASVWRASVLHGDYVHREAGVHGGQALRQDHRTGGRRKESAAQLAYLGGNRFGQWV